jgi:hypothetical protein
MSNTIPTIAGCAPTVACSQIITANPTCWTLPTAFGCVPIATMAGCPPFTVMTGCPPTLPVPAGCAMAMEHSPSDVPITIPPRCFGAPMAQQQSPSNPGNFGCPAPPTADLECPAPTGMAAMAPTISCSPATWPPICPMPTAVCSPGGAAGETHGDSPSFYPIKMPGLGRVGHLPGQTPTVPASGCPDHGAGPITLPPVCFGAEAAAPPVPPHTVGGCFPHTFFCHITLVHCPITTLTGGCPQPTSGGCPIPSQACTGHGALSGSEPAAQGIPTAMPPCGFAGSPGTFGVSDRGPTLGVPCTHSTQIGPMCGFAGSPGTIGTGCQPTTPPACPPVFGFDQTAHAQGLPPTWIGCTLAGATPTPQTAQGCAPPTRADICQPHTLNMGLCHPVPFHPICMPGLVSNPGLPLEQPGFAGQLPPTFNFICTVAAHAGSTLPTLPMPIC